MKGLGIRVVWYMLGHAEFLASAESYKPFEANARGAKAAQ